jgi:hypothetical protein
VVIASVLLGGLAFLIGTVLVPGAPPPRHQAALPPAPTPTLAQVTTGPPATPAPTTVPTSATVAPSATTAGTLQALDGGARVEAEEGGSELDGGARVLPCAGCSGGQRVGSIGDGGELTIHVEVQDGGIYRLTVAYVSAEPRAGLLRVDDNDPIPLPYGQTPNWDTPATLTVQVNLDGGGNSLTFSNNAGLAPDIDAVAVQRSG